MSSLTTEANLAEQFGLTVEKCAELRRRHGWPHVRLTRFDIRYTPEQVQQILAMQTVRPIGSTKPSPTGQTARSIARSVAR